MTNNMITALTSNSTIVVIIAVAMAIVWLIHRVLKLGTELNELKRNQSQNLRDAVYDAGKKIEKLQNLNLTPDQIKIFTEQVIKTIPVEKSPADTNKDSIATEHSEDEKKQTRLSMFIRELFLFGFLTVWGLGWGFGAGSFALLGISELWNWIESSYADNDLLTTVWRGGILVLSVIVAVGIWVIPTIIALLGAFSSFLNVITAVFPNTITKSISKKLVVLKEKFIP